MSNSVYKVVEIVGTSENSWEEAAKRAIQTANNTLRDVRVAEITKMDMRLEDSRVISYRTRVQVSFKIEL